MLSPATSAALDTFAREVRARIGHRLQHLALFGSHARGTATADSDLDVVVVVVHELTHQDAKQVDAIVGDLLTQTDVLLSPLVLSAARFAELRQRERLLAIEIERDGIPL